MQARSTGQRRPLSGESLDRSVMARYAVKLLFDWNPDR
jgi:hypothetical protein